jgi:hypothetical protein
MLHECRALALTVPLTALLCTCSAQHSRLKSWRALVGGGGLQVVESANPCLFLRLSHGLCPCTAAECLQLLQGCGLVVMLCAMWRLLALRLTAQPAAHFVVLAVQCSAAQVLGKWHLATVEVASDFSLALVLEVGASQCSHH